MKTIEEIMTLVDIAINEAEDGEPTFSHRQAIESALRELVERKPLSISRIIEIQESHVGGICPEYPLDGSDWRNFARAIEIEHGIGA